MSRFANTRKVTAYAGLDPLERSSAERQRFLRISKAGSRVLRFLLVEAAHAAIRKDAALRRFYQRLAERHGRPKAKVAVGRKLLISAYIMLRDEIDYAEFQRRAVAARPARVTLGHYARYPDWAASLSVTSVSREQKVRSKPHGR